MGCYCGVWRSWARRGAIAKGWVQSADDWARKARIFEELYLSPQCALDAVECEVRTVECRSAAGEWCSAEVRRSAGWVTYKPINIVVAPCVTDNSWPECACWV